MSEIAGDRTHDRSEILRCRGHTGRTRGEQDHGVVRGGAPVDVQLVERPVDGGAEGVPQRGCVDGGIRGHHGQHRRHVGPDHAGSLGDPADTEAVARSVGLLRHGVRGHDPARRRRVGLGAPGEQRERVVDSGDDPIHRQMCPDRARRADQRLGRVAVQRRRHVGCHRPRVIETTRAGAGVGPARVDHDGPGQRRTGEMLSGHEHGSGREAVDGEHRRGHGRGVGDDDRQVVSPARLDARRHTCRREPERNGHAHGIHPSMGSPAVSSHPRTRFAHCTAWPAAPFIRLSIDASTMAVPVRSSLTVI